MVKAGAGFWSRGAFDTLAPGISKQLHFILLLIGIFPRFKMLHYDLCLCLVNPWRLSSTNMAPFDQEFYLVMNLAGM